MAQKALMSRAEKRAMKIVERNRARREKKEARVNAQREKLLSEKTDNKDSIIDRFKGFFGR